MRFDKTYLIEQQKAWKYKKNSSEQSNQTNLGFELCSSGS